LPFEYFLFLNIQNGFLGVPKMLIERKSSKT